MAILKPKRGSGLPTGLQQNELAIDVLNKRIYLGNTGGTGDIVSSHITDYTVSLNGATGTVNILGGTGIFVISPTGNQKGITLVNSGVVSFNGLTGSVTGVTTGNANTFVQLQTFTAGISGNGATFSSYLNALNFRAARVGGDEGGQIDFDLPATNTSLTGGVALDIYQNRVRIFETGGTNRGVFIDLTGVSAGVGTNLIGGGGGAVSSVSGSGSGILVSPTTGAVVIQNTGVVSFNSATGAIQGVSTAVAGSGISVSGATGNVTITNIGVTGIQGGTGIAVSASTGNPTIRNTGVLSLNGSTGTITNVAFINTAQTFSALQSFSSGISSAGGTFTALTRFNSGLSSAGGTFTALTRFTSGLSASGATFTGDVNFSALNGRIIANRQLDITGRGIYLQGISTGALVSASTITLPNDGTSLLISSGNGILEFSNSDTSSVIRTTTLSFNTFQSVGLDEYYSKFRIGPAVDPATNLNYNAYLPADTGTIALTKNVVSSFNGLTGAVTGVTTGTVNTFVQLQNFNSGVSSAGGTFASQVRFLSGITCSGGATFHTDINVNSVLIGLGGGNVSTNVGIGANALRANTTGSLNIAVGIQALQSNTTSSQNIGIGRRALNALNSGGSNVAIGANTLLSVDTATNCISLGANSAASLLTGTGNIYIGAGADSSSSARENEIVIGTNVAGLGSNTTVIGPTTQVSATIRGLVDAPSGLSASGISSGSYILTPSGIKALTGTTYTFLSSDNGTVLTHNNSSGCTFTVPTGLPVGYSTTVLQLNSAGTVRFIAASGVTLNAFNNFSLMAGQHASASLISYTTNIFNLSGNLI